MDKEGHYATHLFKLPHWARASVYTETQLCPTVLHSAIRKKVDNINQGKKPQISARKKITFCKEGTYQKPKPKKTLDSHEW